MWSQTSPSTGIDPSWHSSIGDVAVAQGNLPDDPSVGARWAMDASQVAASAQASSTSQPTPPETEAQRRERQRQAAAEQLKAEKTQRTLGLIPNFNTVLNGDALPLTPKQKFDLAFHSATDPFAFATAFVLAGYSEVDDTHTGFHWGAQGYFKRVGANYADTLNGTLIGNALLPVLLKQDPRYFRKGTGSIKSRILYSALSTVICRGDNGHKQFNLSNVGGNFISGAISNIYYPSDETGFELTIINATVVTLEGTLGAQVLEFSPDIIRHFHRKPKVHTP